jgi:hypothetical protein
MDANTCRSFEMGGARSLRCSNIRCRGTVPTAEGGAPLSGLLWVYDIEHDGFRLNGWIAWHHPIGLHSAS